MRVMVCYGLAFLLNSLHHLEMLALNTLYSAVIFLLGMSFFLVKTYNLLFKF